MSPRAEIGRQIIEYLKRIYPKTATVSDISRATRLQSCSVHPWLSTLLADRDVEIAGKKGRSNLYRFARARSP